MSKSFLTTYFVLSVIMNVGMSLHSIFIEKPTKTYEQGLYDACYEVILEKFDVDKVAEVEQYCKEFIEIRKLKR